MFSFVHISDLHLSPIPDPSPNQLINKRILSYLSWIKKGEKHRAEILDQALLAVRKYAPQHLCVTGDLVNLALPSEIEQAADWLRALGPDLPCSIVPGNHDSLVASAVPLMQQSWEPWMKGSDGDGQFPYVVKKGKVAFIGLSSAVPTPPGFASGKLDIRQLEQLRKILVTTRDQGLFRVICLHHPPQPNGDSWRRRLSNAPALIHILEETGAELILHGHLQKPCRSEILGPTGSIPIFGAGSASMDEEKSGNSGHFHGFRLEQLTSGYRIWADHFYFRSKTGIFEIESTEQLDYQPFASSS